MKHYDVFLSILPFREYLKPEDELTLYSQMRILYIYKNFFPKEAQTYLDSKAGNLFKAVYTRFSSNSELTSDLFVTKTTYTTGHSEVELASSSTDLEARKFTRGSSEAELLSSMVIDEITKYAIIRTENTLDFTAGGAWDVYKTAAFSYFTELVSDIQMTLTQYLFPDGSYLELSSEDAALEQRLLLQLTSALELLSDPLEVQNTKYAKAAGGMMLAGEVIADIHSKTNAKGASSALLKGSVPDPSIHSFFKGGSAAVLEPHLEMIYRVSRLLSDMDPFALDAFDEISLADLYTIDRKD